MANRIFLPSSSTKGTRPHSAINSDSNFHTVENEELAQDPYDYFGGPDMGDDYYYYSQRGGRGHEYSTSGQLQAVAGLPM
jgi:hypothetical protein